MDAKIQTKAQDPFSNNVSENNTELFTKFDIMKTYSNTVVLDDECELALKTEVKSKTPFPDSQKQRECFPKHPIKCETVTFSNTCKIDMKTEIEEQTLDSDFGLQNDRELIPNDPVKKDKEHNNDLELDNKIAIKEEPWWLETETSPVWDDIKDGVFPPVKSSRLCTGGVFCDKSSLHSAKLSGNDIIFSNGIDLNKYKSQEGDVSKIPNVEKHISLEHSDEYIGRNEINSQDLYSEQENFSETDNRPHKCKTCDKSFCHFSHLKRHNLIHEGIKSHKCEVCGKSFTRLSSLKRHNLIHEVKKPYKCDGCDKSFADASNLKKHNLIHGGKKPHKCKTCDKSFNQLPYLKKHNLIHQGMKPCKCETCGKLFARLASLKMHYLIHEGKKPHKCKICDKNFTRLLDLKRHNLTHMRKKVT